MDHPHLGVMASCPSCSAPRRRTVVPFVRLRQIGERRSSHLGLQVTLIFSVVVEPVGGRLCAAVGTTGVLRRTATTTRHWTAVAALSANAISGTPTVAVVPGFSRADGAGNEASRLPLARLSSWAADQSLSDSFTHCCNNGLIIIIILLLIVRELEKLEVRLAVGKINGFLYHLNSDWQALKQKSCLAWVVSRFW